MKNDFRDSASLTAQVAPQSLAFPLMPEEAFGAKGLSYSLEPELLGELAEAGDLIQMQRVTLPSANGIDQVDLTLQRLEVITDNFELWLDGSIHMGAEEVRADLSLWSGVVDGEIDSNVYLAFTPTITIGWIKRAEAFLSPRYHLSNEQFSQRVAAWG